MDWLSFERLVKQNITWVLVIVAVGTTGFLLGQSTLSASSSQTVELTGQTSADTVSELQSAISQEPVVEQAVPSENTDGLVLADQSGLININTASQAQLEELPGIGPTKAKAIIEYRLKYGVFLRIDDLLKVKGIGPKTLESLRPKVSL